MTIGAPHGNWPLQYECRHCGTIVVPPSGGK
jgi:ribosomal protein S27E